MDSKTKQNNAPPQLCDLSISAKGLNVLYEETAFISYRGPIMLQKVSELFKFLLLLLE